jgi:putative transposase
VKKQYLKYLPKSSRKTMQDREGLEIPLVPEQVQGICRSELQNVVADIGLQVAIALLEEEVTQLCGAWHKRQPNRAMTRYGAEPGWVMLGDRKVHIKRPRVRSTEEGTEVKLSRYELLQSRERAAGMVVRRVVRGVSCRNYEDVVDGLRKNWGVKKSTVSRAFVAEMAGRIKEFTERRWDGVRFLVIFIDGKVYADELMIAAIGIKTDGTKCVLALRHGATENAEVCKDMLEDLSNRGVATNQMTLFILDGSRALRAAVKRVWGRYAVFGRCQEHKRRNIRTYLPSQYWGELDRRLNEAWYGNDYKTVLEQLEQTARWLEGINPDAARSLREGMEETLTVVRLGIPDLLRQTLSTTNVIESALSVAATASDRVKCWKRGEMRWRWCAAGMMLAEEKFHRVKGYAQIPKLTAALDELALSAGVTTPFCDGTREVGIDSQSQVA